MDETGLKLGSKSLKVKRMLVSRETYHIDSIHIVWYVMFDTGGNLWNFQPF